jgi:hypothetical protein
MKESDPVAWQEIEGDRIPVEVSFRKLNMEEIGFEIGACDPRFPLVIDPVLTWNTFLGSADYDSGSAIAVDASGNIYVTGRSETTWGSPVSPHAGGVWYDAFVAKLNSSGTLQWNTFLGSDTLDNGNDIEVDGSGNVYVTGYSWDSWGTPINPLNFSSDAFVAKLDSSGVLQWNTFMGAEDDDRGSAIALDSSGNIYVGGYSLMSWGSPIDPHAGGLYVYDVFVAQLNSSGVRQWNTFLGSSGDDYCNGITLDASGNVYVTGDSDTSWGAPINAHAGGDDSFVAKLNSSGVRQWNTFMGSSGSDSSWSAVVDGSGNIYVVGSSTATWGSPVDAYVGGNDAFVAKLNSSGVLQWNTFIGSSNWDGGSDIALDPSGNVYVLGGSNASWGTPENPYSGNSDVFAALLNSNGVKKWNTFMGSSNDDSGSGIALDPNENVYVLGMSDSTWGLPINGYAGGDDVFVAKILGEAEINVRIAGINFADGSTRNLGTRPSSFIMGREFTFTIDNLGFAPLNLTGLPAVTLSGSHAMHFQVTQQPSSPVGAFGKTTFKLRTVRDSLPGFLPVGWEYSVSFTVNIPNDDSDESPYDFTIEFVLKKD